MKQLFTVTVRTPRGGHTQVRLLARSARTARMHVSRALLPGHTITKVSA